MPVVPILGASNSGDSTLAADITSGATTLDVATGEGDRFPSSKPFMVSIGNEIIRVGSRSSDTFSGLVRGAEGSTAASHTAAAVIRNVNTAQTFLAPNSMLGATLLAYTDVEHSITSSTPVDIFTWTGLEISASTPILLQGLFRKTGEAASAFQLGFGLNATDYDPLGGGQTLLSLASTTDNARVEQGVFHVVIPARRTGYQRSVITHSWLTDGDAFRSPSNENAPLHDTDLVTAVITSFRLRGRINPSGVTGHVRDVKLYALGYPGA